MSRRESSPPTILIVDDDALITTSLKGLFSLETDYEVLAYNDPRAAAEEAARRPVDVVISDFLMPGMNGVELLKSVRERQPEAVRILLTGFADKENAIRAINEVALYQYIEKPWDNDDLLLLIRNALSERNLRRQLSDKVHELDKLVERHTRLSDRHESVERELERAAEVQRGLLPGTLPELDGFELAAAFQPSLWLGGDYYDAASKDDALVVLLADVSGHGVHAALTSMLLKAVFHECVRLAGSPVELLEEMNQRLYRYSAARRCSLAPLPFGSGPMDCASATAGCLIRSCCATATGSTSCRFPVSRSACSPTARCGPTTCGRSSLPPARRCCSQATASARCATPRAGSSKMAACAAPSKGSGAARPRASSTACSKMRHAFVTATVGRTTSA